MHRLLIVDAETVAPAMSASRTEIVECLAATETNAVTATPPARTDPSAKRGVAVMMIILMMRRRRRSTSKRIRYRRTEVQESFKRCCAESLLSRSAACEDGSKRTSGTAFSSVCKYIREFVSGVRFNR